MKMLDLITTANSNLLRNKTRTFLTILAIFIGSFVIILSNAINAGVNDFIDKQIESAGGEGYIEMMPAETIETMTAMMGSSEVQEYKEDSSSAMTARITEEQLEKARAVEGVKSIDPIFTASPDYITSEKTEKKYAVTNLNVMPRGNIALDVTAGRAPDSDSEVLEIALTEAYVSALGFGSAEEAVGKTVTLAVSNTLECYTAVEKSACQKLAEAKVVGVQAPGVMASGGMRANLALSEKLYDLMTAGMPEETRKVTRYATANVDPEKVVEIKEKFKELGISAMTIDDEVGMIRTFFDAILVVFNIFGGIALLAASIGIINTLFMSVQERTREIGLMKALGLSNAKIFLSFSLEAIFLGFWGSIFGIAISMLLGMGLNGLAHESFLADFPTFELVKFNPGNMAVIVLIIMAIAFLAGTFPARQASRKDPIDALRYE